MPQAFQPQRSKDERQYEPRQRPRMGGRRRQTVDRAADAVRRDQGMGVLHPADQVFQTRSDLGDLQFATFAGVFFIGTVVDKDEPARRRWPVPESVISCLSTAIEVIAVKMDPELEARTTKSSRL